MHCTVPRSWCDWLKPARQLTQMPKCIAGVTCLYMANVRDFYHGIKTQIFSEKYKIAILIWTTMPQMTLCMSPLLNMSKSTTELPVTSVWKTLMLICWFPCENCTSIRRITAYMQQLLGKKHMCIYDTDMIFYHRLIWINKLLLDGFEEGCTYMISSWIRLRDPCLWLKWIQLNMNLQGNRLYFSVEVLTTDNPWNCEDSVWDIHK